MFIVTFYRKEMKNLLLCFAVFSIGVNADLLTLEIVEIQDFCREQAEIGQPLIDQAQNGQFSDDGRLRDYYDCFANKIGYLKAKEVPLIAHQSTFVTITDREALTDWLVEDLQYDSKTTEHVLSSCGLDKPDSDFFQHFECLSKNKLAVDVVSTNYVDRSVEDLKSLQDHCKSKFDVDQNLINEAQNGSVSDSESLGIYYFCYLFKGGVTNASGHISYSYLKNWFELMLQQKSDKVEAAIDRCYKFHVEEEKDVLQIVKCFADEKFPLDVVANQ